MSRVSPPFIDLWQTYVSAADRARCADGLALLSPEHRRYVLSYQQPADQVLHLVGRLLVYRYVQGSGRAFSWSDWHHTPLGKPYLPLGPHFNLSQTDGCVLAAFSSHPIGVDVEKVRPINLTALWGRLHANERAHILPAADQADAFFTLWTRKEALLKALGTGLSQDPAVYDSTEPVVPAGLDWHLHQLPAAASYRAALATPLAGATWRVTTLSTADLLPGAPSPP